MLKRSLVWRDLVVRLIIVVWFVILACETGFFRDYWTQPRSGRLVALIANAVFLCVCLVLLGHWLTNALRRFGETSWLLISSQLRPRRAVHWIRIFVVSLIAFLAAVLTYVRGPSSGISRATCFLIGWIGVAFLAIPLLCPRDPVDEWDTPNDTADQPCCRPLRPYQSGH